MGILARACSVKPKVSLAPSSVTIESGDLCADVLEASALALSQAEAASGRWVVGASSCLVRSEVGLKSAELGRLQPGAVVEQLEQQGLRLRVRSGGGQWS